MERKTTDPKQYIELLEVFRLALIHGVIDKQDIIAWADQIIQSDTEPDYLIIEMSLAGNNNDNEMLTLLNAYIAENKTLISGRVILGLLYKQLINQKIDLEKVVRSVYWIIFETDFDEKDKRLLYRLDDHYDLALGNIAGSIDNVRIYTLDVLKIYSGFTIDNFSEWKEINIEVDRLVDAFDGFLC